MICSRRLVRQDPSQGDVVVLIDLHHPQARDGVWSCNVVVQNLTHVGSVKELEVFGADSFQAILLGMQTAAAVVYTSEAHRARRLRAEDGGPGYGLPLSSTLLDLTQGIQDCSQILHVC